MTRYLPQTYTVTCSPALMTDAELRRAMARTWNSYATTVDIDALPALKAQYQTLADERDRRGLHI